MIVIVKSGKWLYRALERKTIGATRNRTRRRPSLLIHTTKIALAHWIVVRRRFDRKDTLLRDLDFTAVSYPLHAQHNLGRQHHPVRPFDAEPEPGARKAPEAVLVHGPVLLEIDGTIRACKPHDPAATRRRHVAVRAHGRVCGANNERVDAGGRAGVQRQYLRARARRVGTHRKVRASGARPLHAGRRADARRCGGRTRGTTRATRRCGERVEAARRAL